MPGESNWSKPNWSKRSYAEDVFLLNTFTGKDPALYMGNRVSTVFEVQTHGTEISIKPRPTRGGEDW